MKKIAVLFACACLLVGCGRDKQEPSETQSPKVSEKEVSKESAQPTSTAIPMEEMHYETVECCVEEDLPMSLKVTIEDLEVVFSKDVNFHCDTNLAVGDMVEVTYTGTLNDNPVAYAVKKK